MNASSYILNYCASFLTFSPLLQALDILNATWPCVLTLKLPGSSTGYILVPWFLYILVQWRLPHNIVNNFNPYSKSSQSHACGWNYLTQTWMSQRVWTRPKGYTTSAICLSQGNASIWGTWLYPVWWVRQLQTINHVVFMCFTWLSCFFWFICLSGQKWSKVDKWH